MSDNMPLWIDLLEEQVPEGDDPRSWCARAVDEIIADEEEQADDEDYSDPYWRRGEWSEDEFQPF
jgi:hypothetical protein